MKNLPQKTTVTLIFGFFIFCSSCGKSPDPASSIDISSPLNPGSKGEQLNPGSKGEQLNPVSKGEYIIAGQIKLTEKLTDPSTQLTFLLNGAPLPSEWLTLQVLNDNTFYYSIRNLDPQRNNVLDVRYQDQALSSMVPESTSPEQNIDIDLRSSLMVTMVRLADLRDIRKLDNWNALQLQSLSNRKELDTLLERAQEQLQQGITLPTVLAQISDTEFALVNELLQEIAN